jgi:Fe2+ transport system protein FeoA
MDATQQAKSVAILLEESMLERMSSLGIVDGTCL